jgi:hypothetical protein
MFQTYSASSNMMPPSTRNTHHQSMPRPCMGQKPNMQQKMKHLLSLPNNVSPYKKSQDPFCITPERWTHCLDAAKRHCRRANKKAATNQLLDYLVTHADSTIRYHASYMILHIHSDVSCLSVSNTCSHLGGLFFCGDKSPHKDNLNGSILNVASVIKNVVASAAESEVGACFQNAQSGAPLRVTLTELGHIHPNASPHR